MKPRIIYADFLNSSCLVLLIRFLIPRITVFLYLKCLKGLHVFWLEFLIMKNVYTLRNSADITFKFSRCFAHHFNKETRQPFKVGKMTRMTIGN